MSGSRAVVVLTLLSVLVQLPFLREGISPLDEGSILAVASELAKGDVMYRDHVTFIAPLVYELLGWLFRLFGESLLVGRLLQALLFVVTILLGYAVLRRTLPVSWALAGGAALIALKPLGFPLYTMVNYSQLGLTLTLGALLCALRFVESGRTAWLAAAGGMCGLCFLTKQNLGAISICAVASASIWGLPRPPTPRGWALPSLVLLVTAMLPLALAAALYGSAGALDDAIRLVVVRALEAHADWVIPLPPLAPWGQRADSGALLYAYLPGPLADLQFQGLLVKGSAAASALEWAVKLAYVVPLAAAAWLAAGLLRGGETNLRKATATALAVGAILAFVSMLYRADWAHLVNGAPMLILATVYALSPRRLLGSLVLAGWLSLASVAALALGIAQKQVVETPRGRVVGLVHMADQLSRVLEWSASIAADQRVAFLPAQPLLHFLTGRPLPLSVDLVISKNVKEPEDHRLARELVEVDLVVFDPHSVPWVEGSLYDFAPGFASVLAERFEPVGIVSPTALVLQRQAKPPAIAGTIADLWPRASEGQRQVWLGYRSVAPLLSESQPRDCLLHRLRPERGQELWARPLFDPKTWAKDYRGIWFPEPSAARFEVLAQSDGTVSRLYAETHHAGLPGAPVTIPLTAYVGKTVELSLCIELEPGPTSFAPAGWAEPRIVSVSRR